MGNMSVFNVSGGGTSSMPEANIAPAAVSQNIPHSGRDGRLALRVANDNATAVVVKVAAGNGPRAALGDMNVTVDAGETAYIALFDTARYKDLTTGNIAVALTDEQGNELTMELAAVQVEAVQL
jgi:hypothetical protein